MLIRERRYHRVRKLFFYRFGHGIGEFYVRSALTSLFIGTGFTLGASAPAGAIVLRDTDRRRIFFLA